MIITALVVLAPALARAEPAIQDLTVKALSHVDGKIYDLDKLPQDDSAAYEYGGDMDLLVGVAVSGESTKPTELSVELKTPGFSSEATGKVKGIKTRLKRKIVSSADKRWFFFVLERPCDKATFSARLGASTKKLSLDMFCAE
jgi:hypothetical protein